MHLSCVIVDDESKLRRVTRDKLARLCPHVEVVAEAADASEAYAAIRAHEPDLVFLDIAMPGESGFDLLARFGDIGFEIVFVTGFNDYALDALRASAVDYLLKPVGDEDLVRAVERVAARRRERAAIERYAVLRHNVEHVGRPTARIAVPGAQSYDFVAVGDVVRCEGWEKYTRLHLAGGQVLVASVNIGHFRSLLAPYGFFLTHKSHLVNPEHVRRYLREGSAEMSDGASVPVARRRRDAFLRELAGR